MTLPTPIRNVSILGRTHFFILLACLLLTGCRGKHKEYRSVEIDGQSISLAALYDSLASSYKPWSDLYVPVSLSLQSPTSFSISGRATMVRDQQIHISLRMLGMEVGLIHVSGDSAFVVDKYHKKYLAESISRLLGGYPLTIADIQDLLLGQAFLPGEEPTNGTPALSFDNTQEGQWLIMPSKKPRGVEWWCTASETLPPVMNSITFLLGKGKVDCLYATPMESAAGIVNSSLTIGTTTSKMGINAQIKWNMRDAKWNTGRQEELKIPKGCQRIDAKALLSNIEL